MKENFEYKEVETGLPAERVLDVAAVVANLVPLIGGPVSSIISAISGGRKEQRVLEVIQGVSDDLRDFKSKAAEEYVKTEDFEDLVEKTLHRVADERSAEKRRFYRCVLTHAIKHPVLRAILQTPASDLGIMGSPMQTLRKRLPEYTEAQIEQLVGELNDRRITSITALRTMMTAHGAADLRGSVTSYGKAFLGYLENE